MCTTRSYSVQILFVGNMFEILQLYFALGILSWLSVMPKGYTRHIHFLPLQWIKSKLSNFRCESTERIRKCICLAVANRRRLEKKHVATRFPLIHYDKLQQISVCVWVDSEKEWGKRERVSHLNGAFEKWLGKNEPNFNRQPNLRLAFPALFYSASCCRCCSTANENCFRWFLLDFRMYLIWNS